MQRTPAANYLARSTPSARPGATRLMAHGRTRRLALLVGLLLLLDEAIAAGGAMPTFSRAERAELEQISLHHARFLHMTKAGAVHVDAKALAAAGYSPRVVSHLVEFYTLKPLAHEPTGKVALAVSKKLIKYMIVNRTLIASRLNRVPFMRRLLAKVTVWQVVDKFTEALIKYAGWSDTIQAWLLRSMQDALPNEWDYLALYIVKFLELWLPI